MREAFVLLDSALSLRSWRSGRSPAYPHSRWGSVPAELRPQRLTDQQVPGQGSSLRTTPPRPMSTPCSSLSPRPFVQPPLGRQVGASVARPRADLVAIGCKEVPRAWGGSYWPEGTPLDARDHKQGPTRTMSKRKNCRRHPAKTDPVLKDDLTVEASSRLLRGPGVRNHRVRPSRARGDGCATLGCALRSACCGSDALQQRFPSHNCTRRIIAAGIGRVVYIEPYPKSNAKNCTPTRSGSREWGVGNAERRAVSLSSHSWGLGHGATPSCFRLRCTVALLSRGRPAPE